jgi:hypothetical protein
MAGGLGSRMWSKDLLAHQLLFLQLVCITACSSGTAEPDQREAEVDLPLEWIYSSWVGDYLRIYVRTPDSFSSDDAPDTHLVILLDADWYMDGSHERLGYGGVVGFAESLARAGTIPEVAILGIGEIDRDGENTRGRDFEILPSLAIRTGPTSPSGRCFATCRHSSGTLLP